MVSRTILSRMRLPIPPQRLIQFLLPAKSILTYPCIKCNCFFQNKRMIGNYFPFHMLNRIKPYWRRFDKVLLFLREGRWRKGCGAWFLLLFQNVRSPKHPAGTLWHRPGAAPNSPWLPPAAKGAAWLRPCVIEQDAKGS